MVRTRKKSQMSESEDEVATVTARRSSRRSSRSTTKVLYEEDDIDPEALQAVIDAGDGESNVAPAETKPKRGRKPKAATTPVKATPKKRGRKSNAQKKAEAEAEEAALLANIAEEPEPEEAKDEKAVAKEPESASEAVLSDLNGKSGQVISPAAASDQVADDQNEPKEKEPLVAKEPEPEAEVEAAPEPEPETAPEPEPEPAQAAEPEPESEKVEEAAPEKEEEPFEVVQKEDLPEEESIEKIEAPVEEEEEKMLTEKADETPAQESEKKGEDDELPDFEDEEEPEQNEDALQLDANIEEDDDLNKTMDVPKADANRKREASAEIKKQRSPSPPRKRESLTRIDSRQKRREEKIRAPSPPPGEESQVVHVLNLVRPFTNKQLLEFLKEAGELDEDSFWIDRIKSNCIVKYNALESAINCRKLVHGKNWPSSNPKELRVMYSTEEKLKEAKENGSVSTQSNGRQRSPVRRFGGMRSEEQFERDRKTGRDRRSPIRAPRAKTESPVQSEESEGEGGISLDELFKKTKTVPSLYWLPLTEDEVITRDKAREERRKAREERRKQSDDKSRPERRRSNSRRRSPARRSRSRRRSVSRSRKSVSRKRSGSR